MSAKRKKDFLLSSPVLISQKQNLTSVQIDAISSPVFSLRDSSFRMSSSLRGEGAAVEK